MFQIHQNYGCINFGTAESEVSKYVNRPLPITPSAEDPPIICPFFTQIDDVTSRSTMFYWTMENPNNTKVGDQIAKDIVDAGFMGQRPQLDRVFFFLWENVDTEGEKNKVLLGLKRLCKK